MEGASAVAAIGSILSSTLKITERSFEICAVDSQAKAVLQTVCQVDSQLKDAKTLRWQKSTVLTSSEQKIVDNSFQHTENAIRQVAGLVERARVDISAKGKIGFNTRLLYVLRDSPSLHVSLTQLGIATQSLNTATLILTSRACSVPALDAQQGCLGDTQKGRFSDVQKGVFSDDPYYPPPPTYEESTYLSEMRARNLKRRASPQPYAARSRSSSPSRSTPWLTGNATNLSTTRPALEVKSFSVPAIPKSQSMVGEELVDIGLFQEATISTTTPTSELNPLLHSISAPQFAVSNFADLDGSVPAPSEPTWDAQRSTFVSQIDESNFLRPGIQISELHKKNKSWSALPDNPSGQLCLGTYAPYNPSNNRSTGSPPTFTKKRNGAKQRDELWF